MEQKLGNLRTRTQGHWQNRAATLTEIEEKKREKAEEATKSLVYSRGRSGAKNQVK